MDTNDDLADGKNLNRRDLLKVAGMTGAVMAFPMVVNANQQSMEGANQDMYSTDVLVVGSGYAGVFAALTARETGLKVTMVDKGTVGRSGLSPWASDCRPFREGTDDRAEWIENVSYYTEFVNDRKWLEIFMDESMGIYETLMDWGCGKVHPYQRADVFIDKLKKAEVEVVERVMITSYIQQDDGRVVGAVGFSYDDSESECKSVVFKANVVIMCTGAGGYKSPGFPNSGQTFDGDAMAYSVGAYITGKEFHDTHGTWSTHPASAYDNWNWAQSVTGLLMMRGAPPKYGRGGLTLENAVRVYSEGVSRRGRGGPGGGRPRPESGNDEPPPPPPLDYDRGYPVGGCTAGMGVHKGEGVFCSDYTCAADDVPGLYAAGDALGSMMTGSVYPARGFSSFLSAIQGRIAAKYAVQYVKDAAPLKVSESLVTKLVQDIWVPRETAQGYSPRWVIQVLQSTMTPYHILYVKEERRLEGALASIEHLRAHCVPMFVAENGHELRLAHEAANMLLNAEMKLRAGLYRKESRGTHYREDYPARNDAEWLAWIKIKNENGKMALSKHPIPDDWRPDKNVGYRELYPRVFPGEDEHIKRHGIS